MGDVMGEDSPVLFCATMTEERDTNSYSQFISSGGAHTLIKTLEALV